MKIDEFIDWLRTQKNPDRIKGMEKYMRDQFKFLGLQAKERRQLAHSFLINKIKEDKAKIGKENASKSMIDWSLLETLWLQPEREYQLIGIDYLKAMQKHLVLEDFLPLRQLVETKSWWDTVDFLSKNIGAIVQKEPQLIEEMLRWSVDENIWIRRVSILHQLSLKTETNTALLKQVILNNKTEDEFFIQKAIGWALREYAKTDKEWVRSFVDGHINELSRLSVREATKNLN